MLSIIVLILLAQDNKRINIFDLTKLLGKDES